MSELSVSDPGAGFKAVREELIAAFEEVLDSDSYILAHHVREFEREWACYCEADHAVGLSSGTDALALALRAVGVGPGDEVLVPAMTAVATWSAVSQIGATPVGVDIEPERNAIDPQGVLAAIGPRTRAVVAVHLFGQPADMGAIARVAAGAGLPLVEDAAQAHGARVEGGRVGSLGTIACFSFYPTKNLAAMGDAGAVTTSAPDLAERVRALREYGWRGRENAELRGVNARLDEIQAALLRVMLTRLRDANSRRREIAETYLDRLAGVSELELPAAVADSERVWHQFVVRHPRRDALAQALRERGIGTAIHYASLPSLNPAFRDERRCAGTFPVAERHAARALSLPMHPALKRHEVEHVIDGVRSVCASS